MANPQQIDQKPLSLVEVKEILTKLEQRDQEEVNFRSKKAKEFLDTFVNISPEKKAEIYKKIQDLNVTRLKEEHLVKILDFLPQTVEDLRTILQAYPLSLSKKDQDSIVKEISDTLKA